MNAHLNTRALTLAGALAGAVVTVLCFVLYALTGTPDPWMALLPGSGPTPGGWVIGMVEGAVTGALTGWVVALGYNRFAGVRA